MFDGILHAYIPTNLKTLASRFVLYSNVWIISIVLRSIDKIYPTLNFQSIRKKEL